MKHQLRILKISKGMNAQTSRYRANPIWDPQPWLKPVNTEHNLEPSRLNPTLVDEYDKIQRKFKPGDHSPLAYQGTKQFPDYYKPYLTNYNGHGHLLGCFAFFVILYFIQREHVKKVKGRRSFPDFSEDYKNVYNPYINWTMRKEYDTNPDPLFKYVNRYVRESGF